MTAIIKNLIMRVVKIELDGTGSIPDLGNVVLFLVAHSLSLTLVKPVLGLLN